MPKICYTAKKFSADHQAVKEIVEEERKRK